MQASSKSTLSLLRQGPWWLGIGVMFFGGVCLYASSTLDATAQYAAIGPGMFVTGVGIGLIVLGVLLLVQIARGEVFESLETENASADQAMDKKAFCTALLATVLPALIIDVLGLPLTAMLSFMLVARAFGSKRIVLDLTVGLMLGIACWLLFGWLGLQLGNFLPLVNK